MLYINEMFYSININFLLYFMLYIFLIFILLFVSCYVFFFTASHWLTFCSTIFVIIITRSFLTNYQTIFASIYTLISNKFSCHQFFSFKSRRRSMLYYANLALACLTRCRICATHAVAHFCIRADSDSRMPSIP